MFSTGSAPGSSRSQRAALALSVVVLLLAPASCAEHSDAGLSPSSTPSFNRTSVGQSVFVVDPTPVVIPTYDGTGQAVHPDIVAFDADWHGAKYWLTMTPYAGSNQVVENPSILASADGMTFRVPTGLKNPVVRPPKSSTDYNSDPELVYEPQSDQLVLFHRFVEKKTNTIGLSTSRDGVTWALHRAPFWERAHKAVSPTVVARTGQAARMWYVDAGKDGCNAKSTRVVMRTSADQSGRIVDVAWNKSVATDLSIPGYNIWHIKARWIPERAEYWMLMSAFATGRDGCVTDDLFFARSTDGTHWTTYTDPILRHEDRAWTAGAVYRTSFVYDAENDLLKLWVSARDGDGAWHIGFAEARYALLLDALVNHKQITPTPAIAYTARKKTLGDQP